MKIKNLLKFITPLLSISFFTPLILTSCSNNKPNSNSSELFKEIKTINSLTFVFKYFIIPNQNDQIPPQDKILLSNFNSIIGKILGDNTETLTTNEEKIFYSQLLLNSIFFWQNNSLADTELLTPINFQYFVNRVNTIVEKYSNKSNMWDIFMKNLGFEWNIVSNEIKNKITSSSFQEVGLNIVFPRCFGSSNKPTKLWLSLNDSEKESIKLINALLSNWYWIPVNI